jgi:hypothetical protein
MANGDTILRLLAVGLTSGCDGSCLVNDHTRTRNKFLISLRTYSRMRCRKYQCPLHRPIWTPSRCSVMI